MKKTVLSTVLSTAFIVALGASVSACGGGKEHEVYAKDRVDEAAALAIKNGPPAEEMEFPETAPMPAADMTADGTAVDGATTAEAGMADTDMAEATATDSADTAAAPTTDSTDMATEDAAATTAE
ncbi:hypothetical protein [Psychrobacter glaciei]|nr:hypothetical protein [Psychrobacter glaciei]